MDCKKCHIKCKAECCGVCPIPSKIYDTHLDKIVNEPESIKRLMLHEILSEKPLSSSLCSEKIEYVMPVTKNLKCPFLNQDYSCNIYEDRPPVCRKFGDESHPFLTCRWLSKDNKERSRQERRMIEREIFTDVKTLKEKIDGI